MGTLSLHAPALATALVNRHLVTVHAAVAGQLAAQTAGGMTIGVVILIATILTAVTRAFHGVFTLFAQFIRLAATMAAVLMVMMTAIVLAVAILVQH
jgi:hypothetical protein